MTSPARNNARMSINPAGVGLAERDMNLKAEGKGKKRAVQSMGGFGAGGKLELSPKSQARRSAVCLSLFRLISHCHSSW